MKKILFILFLFVAYAHIDAAEKDFLQQLMSAGLDITHDGLNGMLGGMRGALVGGVGTSVLIVLTNQNINAPAVNALGVTAILVSGFYNAYRAGGIPGMVAFGAIASLYKKESKKRCQERENSHLIHLMENEHGELVSV